MHQNRNKLASSLRSVASTPGLVILVAAVLLMFIRDVRPLAVMILLAGVVGVLAAGTLFGVGALLAFVGAAIALTVQRDAALI